MAESFAFEIAGQMLGKVKALAVREIGLIWGVKTDLDKLGHTVSSIQAVLLDAAELKRTSKHVADWLEKLNGVLEDATDLLDDFMTEELRREVLIKGSKWKAIENFFSSSNPLFLRIEMSGRLKKILNNLEDIDADRKRFQFVEYVPNRSVGNRETHSFVRASEVIGRDGDKDRVIEILLSTPTPISSSSSMTTAENIHVLPIVGLGGLGKTTFAKLVYNDDVISSHFELKLWICVSEEFDLKKLIEKIMKDATGGVDHSQLDLNQLQARLRNTLESKKFLLIFDDVWTEDLTSWTELKELLICGSHGSKIVVTTRKRTTAEIMGTFPMYELKGLSDDECMSIFVRCAFKQGEDGQYKNLLEIGKAIVKKCNGLPLAVKSLGSLLLTKRDEREWLLIRDKGIWEIAQKENDIIPILKLSYDDMPQHLKQCFAYCAIFPKDIKLHRMYIVNQWMAHGLLNSAHDESQVLEDIGVQYLQELISRSFFQDVDYLYNNGTIFTFQMHDLVHDLALSVAGKAISHIKLDSTKDISEKTRHLLICDPGLKGTEFPQFLLKLGKLRTVHFQFKPILTSNKFLDTLTKTFTSLRNLQLARSKIEELPNSIGMLKNLRILDLSNNINLKRLSNNLCTLINLQTLYLYGCTMLQDLPREFGNLKSLRLLTISGQMKCFPMKGVAEGLTSLQLLWLSECVHLESLLEGIQYLVALRVLSIHRCPNLTSLPAQSMRYLTSLEHLYIIDCEKFDFSFEDHGTAKNLVVFNPHDCAENLKEDCQPETGKYFPFISHIPQIDFT